MLGERGFWPAVALVVAGHGAVLTQWRPAPWSIEQRPTEPPPALIFHVRPVQPAPTPAVAQAPAPRIGFGVSAPAPPESTPAPQPAPGTPEAAPPVDPPYFPRNELTVTPAPRGPIDIPFPEDIEGVTNLRVQATLFIDEDGVVRRVRVDTPDIHPSFHRVILEAFSSARFDPGQIEALPVRSQMRVEVEFQAPVQRR